MRRAEFAFIVGAPRCGTTSLAKYLSRHPEVCFSSTKEPHFFARFDLRGESDERLREIVSTRYLSRYFAQCAPSELRMEGSVTSLYAAEQMVEPVLRFWPGARFIIALRDPLEMLPSLHQRLLVQGDEVERDFERAWQLRHQRAQGRRIPKSCAEPRFLQYEEAARLGSHTERFVAAAGRERCHFFFVDAFRADPRAEYLRVLRFLGLPDDGRTEFPNDRPGGSFRIGWLQRLLKRPPVITRHVLAGKAFEEHLKPLEPARNPSPIAEAIKQSRKKLLRWNSVPAVSTHLSPALRDEIADLLRDDVAKLERITGRDLGHWLKCTPEREASVRGTT
ncbi:sulfotransferase family protein [Sphingomonas sp. GCM10030256]|uniref:sulfotransferase family protein n=1 Tax=Sphingomonas sp. GCM10030256 TaxID=3273427 RepID=UPI00361212B9